LLSLQTAMIAAIALSLCSSAAAQDRRTDLATQIELKQLQYAAKKQKAAAKSDDGSLKDIRGLTIAPTPVVPLPIPARQQQCVKSAEDAVKAHFQPGPAKYAYALDSALSAVNKEVRAGRPVTAPTVPEAAPVPLVYRSPTFLANRPQTRQLLDRTV